MTVRILRDVEEALSREVRRITFHDDRSLSHTVLKDTFDPVTGEVVSVPIEPTFYDSSADTRNIQYPHFFIKLLRTKEDRTTGRVEPQYGKSISLPIATAPRAYEVLIYSSDGLVPAAGNVLNTGLFNIRKVQPGHLLRLLSGNNIGTYKVATVVPSGVGNHTITVDPVLVSNLPALAFDTVSRVVTFLTNQDFNTIAAGDNFVDSTATSWPITAVNSALNQITIGGVGSPSLLLGGNISRPGNIFLNSDLSLIKFTIMDPTKPKTSVGGCASTAANVGVDPSIPLDLYYMIRIDSKERATHIDIAQRMWEEFNPPRTALPVIVRSKLSNEQLLISDVASGGSNVLQVQDNSDYNVGEKVFIFDDFVPTKEVDGRGFQSVFEAQILSKTGTNQITVSQTVPDTFKAENNVKVVSNATYYLYMFHFVDHVTRDVEAAQYWCHEFTFWIQVWVDRQGEPVEFDGVIQHIGISGEDMNGNVIIEC